jgi:hypothetical protein
MLRAVAQAVLEGPRHPDLLRPFPDGWTIRAAFLLKDGLAVVDLAFPGAEGVAATPLAGGPPRWQAGSHEESLAVSALVVSVVKSVPEVRRVVLLVGGEPAETLGGHVDLTHPLLPDLSLADDFPLFTPPEPTPTAAPEADATPAPGDAPDEEGTEAGEEPAPAPRATPSPVPVRSPPPRSRAAVARTAEPTPRSPGGAGGGAPPPKAAATESA